MTLKDKIKKAHEVIREASETIPNDKLCIAWTGGKDSTVLMHLVRDVFGGKVPFPVMFNDSTMEFDEIYDFINQYEKEWDLDLIRVPHLEEDLKEFASATSERKKELSRIMKVNAIRHALKKYGWHAFMVGIRLDEHEARSNETYFSERKGHKRVHPILDFTEDDIWKYTKLYNVPYVDLYDKGYRSLGEKPFTAPAPKGGKERSGRDYDKEELMQQLRDLGYW